MRAACRIVADDLTGALDCAAMFAHVGVVPVALSASSATDVSAPIQARTTGSRHLASVEMALELAACVDWLADAEFSFKKVDSLLRGNSFAEIAWLAASGRFARLVLAPAFPAQGRRIVAGRLVVDGGAAAHHPVLADELKRHGLQQGSDGIARIGSCEIALPDVRDDEDLDAVVADGAREERVLWCGSAGLASAVARSPVFALRVPADAADTTQDKVPMAQNTIGTRDGSILLASASRHPVLRTQWDRLLSSPAMRSSPLQPPLQSQFHLEDFSSPDELAPPLAARALAEGAARIVSRNAVPHTLVAIGGDSLLALCMAAETQALIAGTPPRAGWGSAHLVGGRWDGVHCLSRSGAFGPIDDLIQLFSLLTPLESRYRA